jgi:hypothetical protein
LLERLPPEIVPPYQDVSMSDLSNDALIGALRDADRAAAGIMAMADALSDVLSALGLRAFTARIRMVRQALEWAIADLSVPQIETTRQKAA